MKERLKTLNDIFDIEDPEEDLKKHLCSNIIIIML